MDFPPTGCADVKGYIFRIFFWDRCLFLWFPSGTGAYFADITIISVGNFRFFVRKPPSVFLPS